MTDAGYEIKARSEMTKREREEADIRLFADYLAAGGKITELPPKKRRTYKRR